MKKSTTANDKDDLLWFADIASEVPMPTHHQNHIMPKCQSKPSKQTAHPTGTGRPQSKLFVGSLSAAESKPFIERNHISHILTVAKDLPVTIPPTHCHVKHKTVECHDHPMADILEVMPEALAFLQNAVESDGRILVHCASGISRSVTICAAFLMTQFGMGGKAALESIASVRAHANPNLGFRRQLQLLEKCQGDIADARTLHSKHISNVVEDTIQQREVVNDLHRRVDLIEVSIASGKSQCESEPKDKHTLNSNEVKNELIKLQSELDSCLPDETLFIDPPAKMIRKAANAKIERLLMSLENI
jgi:protein-tyrosine phosphatase